MFIPQNCTGKFTCPYSIGISGRCVGMLCAAWRFSAPLSTRRFVAAQNETALKESDAGMKILAAGFVFEFTPYDDDEGTSAGWTETTESAVARSSGYCGMAGKPEAY